MGLIFGKDGKTLSVEKRYTAVGILSREVNGITFSLIDIGR